MRSFSNHGDDLKMLPHLEGISNGFFVEAGANDGIEQSNTYLYETVGGWSGLLVEPNIYKYKDCVRRRPNSIVEHCALVSPSYPRDTIKGFFQYDDHGDSLCGRIVDDGFDDCMPESPDFKFDDRWSTKEQEPIEVPCTTLSKLLKKHNIRGSDVHFLSLDVEGYEPYVLEGLDLTINRPLHILIETAQHKELLSEFFSNHEYEFLEKISPVNDLYGRKEGLNKKL